MGCRFDPFMNTVLDEATDETSPAKPDIGMVVIRGNSIMMIENLVRNTISEILKYISFIFFKKNNMVRQQPLSSFVARY